MELREGNESARSKLIAVVYGELHRLAVRYMRRERPNHTLQATALVHEAYLQLTPKTVNRDWSRARDWLHGQIRVEQR